MASKKRTEKGDLSEYDIVKKNYKFIRDDEEDQQINVLKPTKDEYGKILAKKYYDKLYKEYALVDLSRYELGQIGMRWRVEKEVLAGKGDSTCGSTKCSEKTNLSTYEVNFKYKEDSETKNALVKVKVCEECGKKLNYKKQHKKIEEKKK